MKRSLLRLTVFLSAPILLGAAWTAYVVAMDRASYARALRLPADATAVVCGDSQTKDALDPAGIPGFVNFSVAATLCDQDFLRLGDLLDANPGRLRHVVLDVSPLKIRYLAEPRATPPRAPTPVSELNSGRVHALLHFYHLEENRRPLGSVGAIWRDVVCVRKFNEFRKSVLRGMPWRSSLAGAFDPGKQRGFVDPKYRTLALGDVADKAKHVNGHPPATADAPLFGILAESVARVRAAGAVPVVTTMPLSRPLREAIDAERLAAFTRTAHEVAGRLGVVYLDYLALDLPDACWHDANHLNREGAKMFTARFAKDFAELRRRDGGQSASSR